MNCLQFIPNRFSVRPSWERVDSHHIGRRKLALDARFRRSGFLMMAAMKKSFHPANSLVEDDTEKEVSSLDEKLGMPKTQEKSEVYSNNMTQAMGAVLTYRHELGMNYNFILSDLIVGSCLQTPADVDKLHNIGVKTIFCLQQDPDLDHAIHSFTCGIRYFGVDIKSIQQHTKEFNGIHHYRAEIRDFDAFDLRMRLPAVVSKLSKAVDTNGGVTYIHCTAGLGRAPAVALTYMYWVLGYPLDDANKLLQSKRPCFPKLNSIKAATADILTGLHKVLVTLKWDGDDCSSVEISGLDIGWGQRIPLEFDKEQGFWFIERELLEGIYEYKYIVDGEWVCNTGEPVTTPNADGFINNYIEIFSDKVDVESRQRRKELLEDGANLTDEERKIIRQFLDSYPDGMQPDEKDTLLQ